MALTEISVNNPTHVIFQPTELQVVCCNLFFLKRETQNKNGLFYMLIDDLRLLFCCLYVQPSW